MLGLLFLSMIMYLRTVFPIVPKELGNASVRLPIRGRTDDMFLLITLVSVVVFAILCVSSLVSSYTFYMLLMWNLLRLVYIPSAFQPLLNIIHDYFKRSIDQISIHKTSTESYPEKTVYVFAGQTPFYPMMVFSNSLDIPYIIPKLYLFIPILYDLLLHSNALSSIELLAKDSRSFCVLQSTDSIVLEKLTNTGYTLVPVVCKGTRYLTIGKSTQNVDSLKTEINTLLTNM